MNDNDNQADKEYNETLKLLIDHGKRQGFITRSEILDCFPQAEYDERIFDAILQAVENAGVLYIDGSEEKGPADIEVPPEEEELPPEELVIPGAELSERELAAIEVDDMVKMYLKEATRVPLLSASEEVELARRIEGGREAQHELTRKDLPSNKRIELRKRVDLGNQAREHMIQANTRLVISIAKKYLGRGLPFLDLIQEGNIGLMRALRNYEYQRGFRFSTYATWWIRQAITRAVANQGRVIRLPVYMSDQVGRMANEQRSLQQKLGRLPTVDELAQALSVSPTKIMQMQQMSKQPLSLQSPVGEDEDEVLGNIIEDLNAPDPEQATEEVLTNEDLKSRLRMLPDRERQILQLRFGLNGEEPLTLQETGRRMGITRERARQLEEQALRRLRSPSR